MAFAKSVAKPAQVIVGRGRTPAGPDKALVEMVNYIRDLPLGEAVPVLTNLTGDMARSDTIINNAGQTSREADIRRQMGKVQNVGNRLGVAVKTEYHKLADPKEYDAENEGGPGVGFLTFDPIRTADLRTENGRKTAENAAA